MSASSCRVRGCGVIPAALGLSLGVDVGGGGAELGARCGFAWWRIEPFRRQQAEVVRRVLGNGP